MTDIHVKMVHVASKGVEMDRFVFTRTDTWVHVAKVRCCKYTIVQSDTHN